MSNDEARLYQELIALHNELIHIEMCKQGMVKMTYYHAKTKDNAHVAWSDEWHGAVVDMDQWGKDNVLEILDAFGIRTQATSAAAYQAYKEKYPEYD